MDSKTFHEQATEQPSIKVAPVEANLFTVPDALAYLTSPSGTSLIGRSTLFSYIKNGCIPAKLLRNKIVIKKADLDAFVDNLPNHEPDTARSAKARVAAQTRHSGGE